MVVDSLLQFRIFLFVEIDFVCVGMIVLGNQVLGLHESLLLHLSDFQLFQRDVHPFALQLALEEVVFFLQVIDHSPLEYLVGSLILHLEVEVVVLEDHLGFVISNLLVQILHFLVRRSLHALDHRVLVVFVLLLQCF